MKKSACVTVLLAATVTACGGGDSNPVGPCVHEYRTPVLAVSAVSASTGLGLPMVTLSQLAINGAAVNTHSLAQVATNVSLDGGTLQCTSPCAFGTTEGTYTFVASAPGFQPTAATVAATYSTFVGGCPSFNSGSTSIRLALTPA